MRDAVARARGAFAPPQTDPDDDPGSGYEPDEFICGNGRADGPEASPLPACGPGLHCEQPAGVRHRRNKATFREGFDSRLVTAPDASHSGLDSLARGARSPVDVLRAGAPGGQRPPESHDALPSDVDFYGQPRRTRCQPSFRTWATEGYLTGTTSLIDQALRRDPMTRDWCMNLGSDAAGQPLSLSIPIASARRLAESPLVSDDTVLRAAGPLGAELVSAEVTARTLVDTRDGYTPRAGLFLGPDPVTGSVRLALRMILATARFFDLYPSSMIPNCSWSSKFIESRLGGMRSVGEASGFGSWSARLPPLDVVVIQPRFRRKFNSFTDEFTTPYQETHRDTRCVAGVADLTLDNDGAASVSSRRDRSSEKETPDAFAMAAGGLRITVCAIGRVINHATIADYYLWCARLCLSWGAERGPRAGMAARRLATFFARAAMTHIAVVAGDLIHELGHTAGNCGVGHCCVGRYCPESSPDDPLVRYDCGHDLPKVLWRQWLGVVYGLPPTWPAARPATDAARVGPGFHSDHWSRIRRFGLPTRGTLLPEGPFSRDVWAGVFDTVGKHCGCVGHSPLQEFIQSEVSYGPSVPNPPTQANWQLCGYFIVQRTPTEATCRWSINPLCSTAGPVPMAGGITYFGTGKTVRVSAP